MRFGLLFPCSALLYYQEASYAKDWWYVSTQREVSLLIKGTPFVIYEWKEGFLFLSYSFMDNWDMLSWGRLEASTLQALRLDAKKEGHFKIFREFKVPPLEKLMSKDALSYTRLSQTDP